MPVRSAQADDEWSGERHRSWRGEGVGHHVAGVAWALREDGVDVPGLDVCVDSTVPLGAGLSSSAALECSVAVAIAHLAGVVDDDAGRRRPGGPHACAPRPRSRAPPRAVWTRRWPCWPSQVRRCSSTSSTTPRPPYPCDWNPPDSRSWSSTRASPMRWWTGATPAAAPTARRPARRSGCRPCGRRPRRRRGSGRRAHPPARASRGHRGRPRRAGGRSHQRRGLACARRPVRRLARLDARRLRDLLPRARVAVETALGSGAVGARMTGGGFGGSAVALVPTDGWTPSPRRRPGLRRSGLPAPGLPAGRAVRRRERPPGLC